MVKGKQLKTRVIHKKSSLKPLTRSIGRMKYNSIAKQALRVSKVRSKVLSLLAQDIQKELGNICSKKNWSILRDSSVSTLMSFTWDTLISELSVHAPTFLEVLRGIVRVKHRVRGKKARARTSKPRENAVVGICAAIMLKNKNIHMNLFQKIVSLILYNGHATKQVPKQSWFLCCVSIAMN